MTNQTPETPSAFQTFLNSIPWTNGRGLVTGSVVLGVFAALSASAAFLSGNNVFTGTNAFSSMNLSGLPACATGATTPPVANGLVYQCNGLVFVSNGTSIPSIAGVGSCSNALDFTQACNSNELALGAF